MKKQIVGIAMLATPFLALFVFTAMALGFWVALGIYGSVVLFVVWIFIGVYWSSQ